MVRFLLSSHAVFIADVEGVVNPLLHRYNAGGCHYSVFGLPAVQVRLSALLVLLAYACLGDVAASKTASSGCIWLFL
jgi:hypothetical protein